MKGTVQPNIKAHGVGIKQRKNTCGIKNPVILKV